MANQEKRKSILRRSLRPFLPVFASFAALLLDTSIIPLFYNGIYMPSVTFALILALSIQRGVGMGLSYGAVTGLIMDISTSYPVGLYTGTYLVAAAISVATHFFMRNTGKVIIQTIIYVMLEVTFIIIAYASTVRMEWTYWIPVLIRVILGTLLCSAMRRFVFRYMTPEGVQMTRSRREQEVNG